jgi:hypothetical protein
VTNAGDLLSAASILLGIITFLYGLWHAELDEAESIQPPRHLDDAGPHRKKVARARRKALIVSGAALLFAGVFVPEVIIEIDEITDGYDAVEVSLILVCAGLLLLAWHSGRTAWRLHRQHRRLTP